MTDFNFICFIIGVFTCGLFVLISNSFLYKARKLNLIIELRRLREYSHVNKSLDDTLRKLDDIILQIKHDEI